MSKEVLGRKIIDLIEENRMQIRDNEEVKEISIDDIRANPSQPRKTFDLNSLKELADSITTHGVLQPIIVKPVTNGYITVAGERRVRASILANKKTIPAIVRDYNSIMLAELALLENIQRENLNPIEEAIAYENILKNSKITHADLALKIGKSRSYVTNIVGLLVLPDLVINQVAKGSISLGHAKILSKLKNHEYILDLTNRIIRQDLSVRELENIIKDKKRNKSNRASNLPIENFKIIEFFRRNTDVPIKISMSKNEVRLKFKNEKQKETYLSMIVEERSEKD